MKKVFEVIDKHTWELLRLTLGFIFLWAFLDKLFGLGFNTPTDKSWLSGSSPTLGFLKFGTRGPLSEIFQGLAENGLIDWLFMLGLLGVGLALILGIGMRIASAAGGLMMFLVWLAVLPPEHHPFLDEHLVYILILLGLSKKAGYTWGLRRKWAQTPLVKKYRYLE